MGDDPMREFDSKLKDRTWDSEILDYVAQIRASCGKVYFAGE